MLVQALLGLRSLQMTLQTYFNLDREEHRRQLLRRHLDDQSAARLELGDAWEHHDLVFPAERGRYWHRAVFYQGYRELVDASGIARPREVNVHTLRHTAASQWIRAGVDLLTVSRRLGHASPILHLGRLRTHADRTTGPRGLGARTT